MKEISIILDAAKADTSSFGRRNFLILLMLSRTGLRVSELVKLRKKDIKDNSIFVLQGKFNKDRVVPLEKELDNILSFYLDTLQPNNKLFNITDRQIRNVINKYAPKSMEMHPHRFRHSFAVHYLKGGGNLRSLQKILGHNNLNSTSVYLDLTLTDVREDFDKIKF
jgi:site-specific recombinase XerD